MAQNVTPWTAEATTQFDYKKLMEDYKCSPISSDIISRFEKLTKKRAHVWLRRGIFFSHKYLENILNRFEQGKPIYIYTGRGPTSNNLHIGHMIPFMFAKYMQEALNATVIIQLSCDEKYYFNDKISLEDIKRFGHENMKDIIACGFDPYKTYIFSNIDGMDSELYETVVLSMKSLTGNQIRSTYGMNHENNIGEYCWPCFQLAPAFSQSFKSIFGNDPVDCLVIMAIDQSPYFRTCGDVANKLKNKGFIKPAEIHAKFLVSLEGINKKLSSSGNGNTIFMSDSNEEITKKIRKSYSGGGKTLQEHAMYGANLSTDVAYQWLTYFMEDDELLNKITREYKAGKMKSGEVKNELASIIIALVITHKENKQNISDDMIKLFTTKNKKYTSV